MDLDSYADHYRRGSWAPDLPPAPRRSILSPNPPRRLRSHESDGDVSSSTTSDSSSSSSGSYSYSSSSDDDTSDTSSGSTYSTTSSSSSSSSSSSESTERHRSKSRRASSPSAEKLAAAAACQALLLKERELKRLELQLADEKHNFSREVKRRVSQNAFSDEDEALAQLQRLITAEGDERLDQFLRGTESPTNPNQGSPRSPVSATGVGMNRVSAFQNKQQATEEGPRTVVDSGAAATPMPNRPLLPNRVTPPPETDENSDTPPKDLDATTPPMLSEEDDRSAPIESGATPVMHAIDPLGRMKEPLSEVSETDEVTSPAEEQTTSTRESPRNPSAAKRVKVKVRRPKRKTSHTAPKAALVKEVEAPAPAEVKRPSLMSPPSEETPSSQMIAPPLHAADLQQQYIPAQLPAGLYAPVQPWNTASAAATVHPSVASYHPSVPTPTIPPAPSSAAPSGAGQPWSALPSSWPCAAPPSPSAPFAQQTPTKAASTQSLWQVTSNMGPLSNTEFKNLLCSEYVPTNSNANTPMKAGADPTSAGTPHVAGGSESNRPQDYRTPTHQRSGSVKAAQPGESQSRVTEETKRDDYEPYGAPQSKKGKKPTAKSDNSDDFETISEVSPPPPPQEGQGGGVLEFPPPPRFTAPDMPPPQPLEVAESSEEDDDACCQTCCCGRYYCTPCCQKIGRCCGCWKRFFRCLFSCLCCCCSCGEEKDAKNKPNVDLNRNDGVPPLEPVMLEVPRVDSNPPPSPPPRDYEGRENYYPSGPNQNTYQSYGEGGVPQTPGINTVEQTIRI